MFHVSENLSIYDVFRLFHEKLIPEGCTLVEINGNVIKELWPKSEIDILDLYHDGTENP